MYYWLQTLLHFFLMGSFLSVCCDFVARALSTPVYIIKTFSHPEGQGHLKLWFLIHSREYTPSH
jgi:hypothetical protein